MKIARYVRRSACLLAVVALALGCASPGQGAVGAAPATGQDALVFDAKQAGDGTSTAKDSSGDSTVSKVVGGATVTLAFEVDDSANKTFADGEIVWTGSFAWDSKTNTVVYATSWLPTDGPYPALYDDGPISAKGHEHEGATKGDHIFSTQVQFVAAADATFEYGALNELGNWMWIGANGQIAVKQGQTGVVAFPGIKLAKHGALDLKVALDMAKLNTKFAKWNLKDYALFIKGSMNMWTPIQLLDDGAKGDDKAGDGVVTYQHKLNLGKHDGGLNPADESQFIFVATLGDQLPDAGLEYKGATEAFKDGIQAWTNTGSGGVWVSVPVVLAKDSKGKFMNTAVIIPGSASGGGCTPVCKVGQNCTDGKCVTPATPCNPPCIKGQLCEAGKCVVPQSKPIVTSVAPSKGSSDGGDSVTIVGSDFGPGAIVRFDKAAASEIDVAGDGKFLTCKTPAHALGLVSVEVENVDGGKGVLADGFSYQPPPKPTVALQGLPPQSKLPVDTEFTLAALVTIVGVTAAPGITPDLMVFGGIGPAGSDPEKAVDKFTWKQATFLEEDAAGGERFIAQLPGQPKGNYAAAVRANWKATTVYSLTAPIAVLDPKDLPSTLTAISPVFLPYSGGTLKLFGVNLQGDASVVFAPATGAKIAATAVKVVAGGLEVTVPALPMGSVDVALKTAAGVDLTLPKALDVVPIATIAIDGALATKWPAATKLATNSVVTAWGPGKNELQSLFVAYDKDKLYLAIQGTCEPVNAVVAYLDVDYGNVSGVNSPLDLKDNTGAVDDAISGVLKAGNMMVGLDFAFASVGMAAFDGSDLAKSLSAGWRSLAKPTDLAWLNGPVLSSANAIEASISLKTLYPQGIPATGAYLQILVALVNANGSSASNQFLPEQKAQADAQTFTVMQTVRIYPVP